MVCETLIKENVEDNLNFICESCKLSIVERGENYCPVCGRVYEGVTGISKCSECIKEEKPFDRIFYHFVYGGAIQDAISSFKYKHNLRAGRGIVMESYSHLREDIKNEKIDLIIPVPQHIIKNFTRGFSQSAFIASLLSRLTHLPVKYNLLKKVRFTKSQVGLSREERLVNLRGSFRIKKNQNNIIEGKRILLVDDVYTTGATTATISDILIKSGAESVSVFVLARGE